jgi:multidrug resistance protein EbrA
MNPFIILAVAILAEVFGGSMLKVSQGFKKILPSIGVIAGMGIAFYSLSTALKSIPLGTAYAIWAGTGTALTFLVGVMVWKEKVNLKKVLGLMLIIGGVIVLKLSTEAH